MKHSLAGLIHRMSQAIVGQNDDRGGLGTPATADRALIAQRRRQGNQAMFRRIAVKIALLLVVTGISSTVDQLRFLEKSLLICSNVSMLLALITREKWSPVLLNRWDEALIFLTLSFGLRVLA